MGTPRQIYLEISSLNPLVLIMYKPINFISIFLLIFSLSYESVLDRKLTSDDSGDILITIVLFTIVDGAIVYQHYDQ